MEWRVKRIPESAFSPAEVILYLLLYRSCLAAIVENCGRWVDGLLKEKKGKRDGLKLGSRNHRS
ncbi:unnamed protein product [Fusarium graminearum]|nr:unnamed protein product [Fusarium graminearum]